MRKLMKRRFWLSAILLSVIILGSCLTTEYITVKPDYSSPPVRKQTEKPETVNDMAEMIVYYEEILSEWESWGISVYETLEILLPDSLQYIKDTTDQ